MCRKCEKWNLTPLEERWEAIEKCEQLFRDSKKRVSTDNIGLARLNEGLELVRIGEPQRPEFAAWRYGDQFGRRRKRGIVLASGVLAAGAVYATLTISNLIVGGAFLMVAAQVANSGWHLAFWGGQAFRKRRVLAVVPSDDGKRWLVRGRYAQTLRLVPAPAGGDWAIEVGCEADGVRRRAVVEGPNARRLAAKLVPTFTPDGGRKEDVLRAVKRIEEKGEAEAYLRWLAHEKRRVRDWSPRKDVVTLERIPPGTYRDAAGFQVPEEALAVEMAVNEENERHALESELALLEEAWREAEEIAGIADRLTLPRDVDEKFATLKQPG